MKGFFVYATFPGKFYLDIETNFYYMKNLALFIPFLLLIVGCNNPEDSLHVVDLSVQNLAGTWKLTEAYVSPGGETTWQSVEEGMEYDFNTDGSFDASEGNCLSGTYNLDLEAERLTFNCENESESTPFAFRILKLTSSEMEISYVGCIEACIYRYRKQ